MKNKEDINTPLEGIKLKLFGKWVIIIGKIKKEKKEWLGIDDWGQVN